MSVDVLDRNEILFPYWRDCRQALTGREQKPITDMIIIFGGWGVEQAGSVLEPDENSKTSTAPSRLLAKVKRLAANSGREISVLGYQGTLAISNRVALQELKSIFHPCMKIILYGYSAGGRTAQEFANQIWAQLRYYNFEAGRLSPSRVSPIFDPSRQFWDGQIKIGITRVDLLITVDAAVGPGSGSMDRVIAPSVRLNVNIYQPYPSSRERSDSVRDRIGSGSNTGVFSHGGPNYPQSYLATFVDNRSRGHIYIGDQGRAHGRIGSETVEEAFKLIETELRRDAGI
jgi:hypothetical protein